jgi:anaerobic selenocysteine-containing dehydrogenase
MHPDDADRLGIHNDETVTVSSRRGSIDIKALISERPLRGTVFVPFHFKEASANVLTNTAVDPVSKIPELKACAVRIEKKTTGPEKERQ